MSSRAAGLGLLLLASVGAASGEPLALSSRSVVFKDRNVDIAVAYPHTGNDVIDAALAAYADRNAADFRKQRPDFAHGDHRHVLDVTYSIERNDGDLLAVHFTVYEDMGGLHGDSAFETFNFVLPAGRRIGLADIVDGQRGVDRVSQLAIADLTSQLAQPDHVSDADWIRDGAGPEAENFTNVILEPHALRIWFAPYEVAAHAEGPRMVEIPLSALDDVLSPKWRDRSKPP
ncbi:MAG: RsiV family protein [Rhizomicrobium sp.]